jgi:flagellar motility protein MotE (MotC chaperone)
LNVCRNLHEQTETALAIGQGELNQLRRDAACSQTRISELKTLQAEVASLREEKARIRAEVDHKADASNNLRVNSAVDRGDKFFILSNCSWSWMRNLSK